METEFKLSIKQLLNTSDNDNVQALINKRCIEYLNNKVINKYPEQVDILKPITKNLSFPVSQYNLEVSNLNLWRKRGLLLMLVIIGCLLFNLFCSLPVIGAVLGFIIGEFCVDKFILVTDNSPNKLDNQQIEIICKNVENLCERYEILCKLLSNKSNSNEYEKNNEIDRYPLENRFYRILEWFHYALESIEGNEWIESDIRKMLNRYGYDLVNYSNNNAGFFEQTLGDVKLTTTSLPALINKETKECIIKGHVIMPNK